MEELVRRHSEIMDKYDKEKKVALVVDEWGCWHECEEGTNPGFLYQQNTMRDAVVAALTLNIFNKHGLNYRDGGNSFAVLEALVIAHIRQFGRLVFGDLLTYVSEICELMSAMGYSTSTLKVLYPNFVGAIVERHGSYIKESLPGSMFAAPSLINFTSSERCKRLAEMTPRLTKIPTI